MTDKEKIRELSQENEYLKKVIEDYEKREEEINILEEKARKKADEIIKSAEKLYDFEADRLRLFKACWDKLYKKLILGGERGIERLNYLAEKIDNIFTDENYRGKPSEKADEARRLISSDGSYVKSDIVIGEGENSFSLSDLITDDSDLLSLCEELGLTEEE